MAVMSHTLPLQPGEENALKGNLRLRRWISTRLGRVTLTPLSDADFHREITKPLTLQIARIFSHMPNGRTDPHARAVR